VACDISKVGKWESEQTEDATYKFRSGPRKVSREESVLTPEVRDWLGLRTKNGNFSKIEIEPYDSASSLVDLNDDHGWDFKKIADFIESEPKGLFV
jgi:hypothetical protein